MSSQPNVVIFMSDQHNRSVMGCADDGVVRTPNLDALAENGVRFTDAYCPSPLCVPSRMSFMTSRYPSDQRVTSNQCILDSNIPTFAHAMTNAGYETVLAGRMHFVGYDQRHGFEKRLVGDFTYQFHGVNEPILDPIGGGTTGQSRSAAEISGPGRTAVQSYDRDVTDAAIDFISERKDDRPFCMVIGTYGPHCPFICPKDLYDEYYDRVAMPEMPEGYLDAAHPFIGKWRENRGVFDAVSPERIRSARAAYYGMVTLIDQCVGRVRDAVEQAGVTNDTVMIYTSDHGEMMGDHGLWWKSTFYEGSAGVPLIASWPGRFAEGRQVTEVVNLVDLGPTALDLGQGKPLPCARGKSLRRFLEPGEVDPGDWLDETYSEHYPGRNDRASRMVRSGPWKLNHYNGYDVPQLFNLEQDPGEWNDLAADPAHSEIRDELTRKVLDRWDGDRNEIEYERLMTDVDIVKTWGARVRPDSPDYWAPAPGANVFPEQ